MSEQLPDPTARIEVPGQGPEASSRQEADGVGAERSSLERSDRLRSGAETPSASPAPCEASSEPSFADADSGTDDQHVPEAEAPDGRSGPALAGRRRGGPRLAKPIAKPESLSPEQRLLL